LEEAPAEGEEEKKVEKDPFADIRQGYQEGIQQMNKEFMNPMMDLFQTFSKIQKMPQ